MARDARISAARVPGQAVKDRRGATFVTPRRLREERVLHSPARYEAGEPFPLSGLSWSRRGGSALLRGETVLHELFDP